MAYAQPVTPKIDIFICRISDMFRDGLWCNCRSLQIEKSDRNNKGRLNIVYILPIYPIFTATYGEVDVEKGKKYPFGFAGIIKGKTQDS
jgi:hypothetical protein